MRVLGCHRCLLSSPNHSTLSTDLQNKDDLSLVDLCDSEDVPLQTYKQGPSYLKGPPGQREGVSSKGRGLLPNLPCEPSREPPRDDSGDGRCTGNVFISSTPSV